MSKQSEKDAMVTFSRQFAIVLTALFLTTCLEMADPPAAHAGAVSGTVKFEGRAPRMRPIEVGGDPGCLALHNEEPLMTELLVLGEGQTMANVFLEITKNRPAGTYPVPEDAFEVTQKGCRYDPHVFAVRAGQPVRFTNPDGLQHNVHPLPEENREVNRAMSQSEREFVHTFTKAEPMFRIKCDVHSWMEAFCAVVDHPFYAVTKEDGQFEISGLPPGEYEIEAWHEVLGTKTATFAIEEGKPTTVDFTYTPPKRR